MGGFLFDLVPIHRAIHPVCDGSIGNNDAGVTDRLSKGVSNAQQPPVGDITNEGPLPLYPGDEERSMSRLGLQPFERVSDLIDRPATSTRSIRRR